MSEHLVLAGLRYNLDRLRRNLDHHRQAKDARIAERPANKAAYLAEYEREVREVDYWAARVAALEARITATAAAAQAPGIQEKAA
jgi:hypothetical protein